MLFDVRGRHRRRAVRVIYTGLALLMGVGLVGFGIGGGFSGGGLLNAASNNEGASSASFASQIKKYRKLTVEQPSNASAWENLTKDILHEAGGEAFVTSAGTVTTKGKELFRQAAEAWSSYIALSPTKPNTELAQLMEPVYGEQGLNEPAKEVEILQIAVAARPTDAALYASLAEYAYKAHNTRVGDLASEKAVGLAPSSQRQELKSELAAVKANPTGGETSSGATITQPANGVDTTTTDGKTITVKPGPNGTFTGTAPAKPTPLGALPSSKK